MSRYNDAERKAFERGRSDRASDQRAGGVGRGNRGAPRQRSDAEVNAYDRGYTTNGNRPQRSPGTHKVKQHRRETESGKVTRVKQHKRKTKGAKQQRPKQPRSPQNNSRTRQQAQYLSSRKATRNLRSAERFRRRGDYRKAAGFACAAAVQFLLIVFVQASVLLVIGLGVCLGALAYMLTQITK